jgi:hypothetical protein
MERRQITDCGDLITIERTQSKSFLGDELALAG